MSVNARAAIQWSTGFGRGNLFRFSMLLSVKLMNHAFDAVIAVSESGAIELKRYIHAYMQNK